jgi:meso-butanediol dehydrogenase/(S,S)-butanediol dehydrogenase/diacetyl reductase
LKLEGKRCIVTGGASGIGRASAMALAAEGARIAVADVDVAGGEETVEAICADGGQAIFVRCDVSQDDDAKRLVDLTVQAFGGLDVLFNNAGINPMEGGVADVSPEEWHRVFSINVDGIYHVSRHAIAELRRSGKGRIINTASPASFRGWRGNAAYIASKGAVMSLTRAMAADHLQDGILVNAVVPGLIITGIGRDFLAAQDDPAAVEAGVPLGRAGQPSEIAPLVVYLASEECSFSTGAPFYADGGELAG